MIDEAMEFCDWARRSLPMGRAQLIIQYGTKESEFDFADRVKRDYPYEWIVFKAAAKLGLLRRE